jgi:TolB protein
MARIVLWMDEFPPPEAFEPQPDERAGGDRLRRRLQVALILLLVTALVVLAAVEGSGLIIRGEDNSRSGPRLAVVNAAGALTWIDPQGRSPVSLSQPGVVFQFPAWSPDGTQIAAIGTGSEGAGVYVVRARAPSDSPGEPTVIYTSADRSPFYLYWTPDGRQLSFLTTEPDGLALRIAPADGSGSAYIAWAGAPMYWDFVDPERMLVHSGPSGPDGFFGEVGLDGSPFAGTDRSAGVFRAPTVSVDGRHRAYFASADGAVGEVVRESRDGTGTTRIRVFGTGAVAFSPTGGELAFVAPDRLTSNAPPLPVGPLRLLDPGASEPRTLVGGSVVGFFWSPTGREIAVLSLAPRDDDVTEALGSGGGGRGGVELARAVRETAAGLPLLLSFVAIADGAIRSERIVRLSDLFINQVLPFFDQYALSHRFWSPDGTSIVLPIVGAGDVTELVVIPASGSETRTVAVAEMGSWSP